MPHQMGEFRIKERMMRYSYFVPRFYNLCLSYGFEPGRIMPSRAFCSDENQGFPIILIAKHFGAFPFDHGRVGGIVAVGRHGPHAHHGKDLVIIQASHVGYDSETDQFGAYRRLQTENKNLAHSCGKICAVLSWYLDEYKFAQENVCFSMINGEKVVVIDNQLLDHERKSGLFLHMDHLIDTDVNRKLKSIRVFSTSKAFRAHPRLAAQADRSLWQENKRVSIGKRLTPDLFFFKRKIRGTPESQNHLEYNLSLSMPHIVTSASPALAAAQFNTQIEFDRTYRSIIKEHAYQGKNLAFIAGVNIDVSPREGQIFPLTKFVPWAAYFQTRDNRHFVLEQNELLDALNMQSEENPYQIDLEEAIRTMALTPAKVIIVDDEKEFAQTLSHRLQIRDIVSAVTYDGEAALEWIRGNEPEVMILDLKMPGIDGIEVLRRVKQLKPHIEVIIVSGQGSRSDREACLKLGAFAYLEKPLNPDELGNVLREANQKANRRKADEHG